MGQQRRLAYLLSGYVECGPKVVGIRALFDSGADATIINRRIVERYHIPTTPLPRPIRFRNADDSVNTIGTVTHRIEANMIIRGHSLPTNFYVADLGRDDAILGIPWIRRYNPKVDWATGHFEFDPHIVKRQQAIREYQTKHDPPPGIPMWGLPRSPTPAGETLHHYINQLVDHADIEDRWDRPSNVAITALWKQANKEAVVRKATMSTNLAVRAHEQQQTKTLDEILPPYLQEDRSVFEKKAAERMPISWPWDHAIDLKTGFVPRDCKIIPLSPNERLEMDKFVDENLAKGYIRPSKSPMASPVFFVKKKDGTLRPVQDYRYLNEGTIKNVYPLPLISDLFDKLKGAKYFTKLDVRAGYNNVRIKDGDQWKAAFKTARGLFEPTVMFFGLCNAPATFQAMMNNIFRDYLAEGWLVIYMDDILLFSDTKEDLQRHTQQVVKRLIQHDLYLKGEKCEFDTQEVEFLGAVIKPGQITMDPIKLDGLKAWQTPQTVKEVQSFLGFANFYRRFI